MTKTYKKIQVVKLSSNFAEATEIVELPLTPPEKDQVLIKTRYCGVNATDVNTSAGRYYGSTKLPFDIGFEVVGTVEAVGQDVKGFAIGDPVAAFIVAGYSEYIYCTANKLTKLPKPDPKYLALFGCGLTATIGLELCAQVKAGQTVLITAAAGGTGHIALQWAKLHDCTVIGTCSTTEKINMLKDLGCDHVINYREEDISEALKRLYPNGVDVIWETIGGRVTQSLCSNLAEGGRMLLLGGTSGYKEEGYPTVTIQPSQLLNRHLVGYTIGKYEDQWQEFAKKQIRAVDDGKLKIVVDLGENSPGGAFRTIEDSARAVEYLHTGKSAGKVLVQFY